MIKQTFVEYEKFQLTIERNNNLTTKSPKTVPKTAQKNI
jgi:hypothetical protein